MRPGISKISEGPGVRERVLVKVGFNYWLNISKSSDTFWGGLSKAGGKGEMREQGRNMCAIGKGQQEGLTSFLNPLPPPPTPSTPTMLHAVGTFSFALRFRASAGDVRMSILLVGGVLDLHGRILPG